MIGPSFGANGDAVAFHLTAVAYSHHLSSYDPTLGGPYPFFLGMIYAGTTPSIFIGCLVSVITWLLSAFLLLKIIRLLMADKVAEERAMLIYAFLPTSILYTSVTLREALQLLFVNLFLFSALKICVGKSVGCWFLLAMAAVGMGVLHGAFVAFDVYGLVLVLIGVILTRDHSFPAERALLIAVMVLFVGTCGLWFFANYSYGFPGGLPAEVEFYHNFGYKGARSQYINGETHIAGMTDLLRFLPYWLWQYLFAPMPWRISSVLDIELLLENILRAWLIWRIWSNLRIRTWVPRMIIFSIFISYLGLEGLWSLGTINWGTAARHHLPSMGLLLAAAFAYDRQPAAVRSEDGMPALTRAPS